jgi:hypothetical protein
MGLPRIVVARMLANSAIDLVIGAIPFLGDAFDLWFKANTRNLGLMRRWIERPDSSTRNEWLAVAAIIGLLVGMVLLVAWLVAAAISALVGAL